MESGEEIRVDDLADDYIRKNDIHYFAIGDAFGRQEFYRTMRLDRIHLVKLIEDFKKKYS